MDRRTGARVVAAVAVVGAVGLLSGCDAGTSGSILGWQFGDPGADPQIVTVGEQVGREVGAESTDVLLVDGTLSVVLADSPLNDAVDPEQTDRARGVAERLDERLPADVPVTTIEVALNDWTSMAGGAVQSSSTVRSFTFPRSEL
jgi:hypothetical protein